MTDKIYLERRIYKRTLGEWTNEIAHNRCPCCGTHITCKAVFCGYCKCDFEQDAPVPLKIRAEIKRTVEVTK